MTDESVTDAELHAYVDGQLDNRQRRAVEAYLATHPEEAERVAHYQQLNSALRKLYEPVLNEPLPTRRRVELTAMLQAAGFDRVRALPTRLPLQVGLLVARVGPVGA